MNTNKSLKAAAQGREIEKGRSHCQNDNVIFYYTLNRKFRTYDRRERKNEKRNTLEEGAKDAIVRNYQKNQQVK